MKRKLLLLIAFALSVLLCTACGQPEYETVDSYPYMDWDNPYGNYTDPAVPDHETALAVAQGIFDGMKKDSKQAKFVPYRVFYDQTSEIWIVSFGSGSEKNETEEFIVDGDFNIAIQKSDGKILKMWTNE